MEISKEKTVFISYAIEDSEASERLYNDLKNAGLIPWRDKEVIKPGQNWKIAIRKGIKSSRYFIPLFSSKSVEKISFVQKEFQYALDNYDQFPESEIYIIPARLDNCDIPYEKLEEIQYVDLFPDWNNGVKQIVESMGIKPEEHDINIEFKIKEGDIRNIECDVVVLKFAQAFYQADYEVATALGILEDLSIPVGEYKYISTNSKISAKNVLFVGVPQLKDFHYEQIRKFPSRFLNILSNISSNIAHLVMTFHIATLDETEAALSLFTGILDSLGKKFPKSLNKITIVDRNPRLVQRLQNVFDANIFIEKYMSKLDEEWGYLLTIPLQKDSADTRVIPIKLQNVIEKTGKGSGTKPVVFVAMPFKKDMEDVFYFGIQDPSHDSGFLCERIDNESFTGDILEQVKAKIQSCAVVVADLTGSNPNVYLEVGYAWGKGKPTILLAKEGEDLKFDVRGYRHLRYQTIKELKDSLTRVSRPQGKEIDIEA